MNSADLFRINLPGINVLLTLYLDAIDSYLKIDFQTYANSRSTNKLAAQETALLDRFTRIRSKSIYILMSIVSLPFHYENLSQNLFENYLEKSQDIQLSNKTFSQYRFKIFPLLIKGLMTEQDSTNVQLLFGKIIEFIKRKEQNIKSILGTIRLACSLAVQYEKQLEHSDEKHHKGTSKRDV